MIVYKGYSLQKAAAEALAKVKALGGEGGLIVLNKNGQFVMDFTTNAMNRGYIDQNGKKEIKIIR
jgi:beta-aspartyl-peptidase (threonine type)